MLKWLKQKPVDGEGAMSSTADKITDDPLATIQVHANVKKSKNKKSNEIYAVSRVNPLFEEDDPKGAFSPGNNSGSSGYDSGPTSDDDVPGSPREVSPTGEEIEEAEETTETLLPTLAHVSRHVGNSRNLFRDTEDEVIIHHEAALVGPDGRPVLQIVQQNPNFVKSIAVAVNPKRPLSPIAESVHSNAEGGAVGGRQLKSSSSFNSKVHAMSVPQRGINEDATGVGKLIQKNPRYVQSIRIGPSSGLRGQPGYFSSSAATAASSSSSTTATPGGKKAPLTRKPSVTFSERVDYVAEGTHRKVSVDHDSIVTDSLLMLTSRGDQFEHIKGNWGTSKVLHVNNADAHNRRYASRSNSNGSGVSRTSGTSISGNDSSEENSKSSSDLEAFANSMKKSRPVKQMVSAKLGNDGEGGLPPGVPSHSSTQAGDTDDDHASDERSESSTGSPHDSPVRPRTPRNPPGARSPFGGIADHYAAAKEIAKEIESYSTGTTKSSTKRSLVRDLLLSNRGRGGSSSTSSSSSSDGHIAINIIGSGQQAELHEEEDEERRQQEHQQQQQQQRQPKELLRVQQQVYVKAKSKQLSTTTTTTSPANPEGQDHIQSNSQQVPIYDALPRAAPLSHGLDAGNSSDRNSGEVRLDMGEEEEHGESQLVLSPSQLPGNRESYRKKGTSSSSVASTSSDVSSSRESNTSSSGSSRGSSNHSKVMLISGDSQNMVVDLSAVPPDLREAILAGTALITLPDGAKKRLEPGYTMIAIPSSSSSAASSSNSSASSTSSSSELKESGGGTNSDKNSGGSSSSSGSASGHSSAGEESPLAQNKFGTKNMTQIWNVMQHNQISATLTSVGKSGYGGKSKKFTTILPFHPNHDSNTSPDFTIEGHRMKMQMQKVQHGKQRRCWCRVCGMLFFLIAFLGILVALSLIYTRGERYFGSV